MKPDFAIPAANQKAFDRDRDGGTPLEIANAFQVPQTTMTHTLLVLERHGLVETWPNPDDGRSKCVWLTSACHGFCDNAIIGMAPEMVLLAEKYPPEYVEDIIPKLAEIRKFLDARRDEPSKR